MTAYARRRRFPPLPTQRAVKKALQGPKLVVPTSNRPVASVIVPVYGQFEATWWCLDSLTKTHCETPYELIIVDDASLDFTPQMLAHVAGIKIVQNETNMGFVRSCNAGASVAAGRYLCFLNNDTRVTDGWLDALIKTFEVFPKVGLVGGKLLFPDGRLQEAGGTVFSDGSCSHYGRNRAPARPEYDYARPVDYCSGACLAIERQLFHELKGFDAKYAPAYYEDTDLAFRVRERGLDVIYQPVCRVAHYEGITHGKSPDRGLKQHQTLNRSVFTERWSATLKTHPAPGNRSWSAGERRLRPGVLAISDAELPSLDTALGHCLLQARSAEIRTSVLSAGCNDENTARALRLRGIEVLKPCTLPAALAPLRTSWSAQFRHALFDGHQLAMRYAPLVRSLAPHLCQWLLVSERDLEQPQRLAQVAGRMDRVLFDANRLSNRRELCGNLPKALVPTSAGEAVKLFAGG